MTDPLTAQLDHPDGRTTYHPVEFDDHWLTVILPDETFAHVDLRAVPGDVLIAAANSRPRVQAKGR